MNYSVMRKAREDGRMTNKLRIGISMLLLVASSFGLVSHAAAMKPALPPPPVHHSDSRPTLTAITALRHIREGLQMGVRGDHGIFGSGCDLKYENIDVTFVRMSYTRIDDCENSRYASPPESVVLQFNRPSDRERIDRLADSMGFLDAVDAISYYSSSLAVADDAPLFADFREQAKAWRALPDKPGLSEAMQRFNTLAEDAIQNKNFEDAVDYYEQGLAVSPLWPEGQFNAALLCGELQIYSQAVLHMKRYLELKPDAPDAQAARSKMIIWEERVRQAGTR